MTATLLASLVLVILTLTAAQARTSSGGWAEFRQFANERSYLIQKTQRVRERRCLEPRRVFHRNMWFRGRPGLYAAAVRSWERKVRRDQARDSRCIPSRPAAIIRYVFPDATEDGAIRVAACESTGDTTPPYSLYARAVGDAGERGLFQIHPQHRGWIGEKRWSRMFDPLVNARVAYGMSKGGRDWSAWTCGWAA